jgi:hypothetical protein
MGEPEELKQTTKVSYGLILWAVCIAASMGYLYSSMHFNDRQAEKNAVDNRLYTEQEVGGLRSDWERQNKIDLGRFIKLEERIKELEDNHKEK